MHQRYSLCAIMALFAAFMGTRVSAATLTWNTGAGDLTGANYTDSTGSPVGVAPTPTNDALCIGNSGVATFSSSTIYSPGRLQVGHTLLNAGDGTFLLNGGTLNLTQGGGTITNSSVVIGLGNNGTVILNSGSLISARAIVVGYGNDLTKTATFNVGASSFIRIVGGAGILYLGSASTTSFSGVPGQMTFAGNGTLAGDAVIGDLAGSSYLQTAGSLTVAGSTSVGRSTSGSSTATFSGGIFTTKDFSVATAGTTQANYVDISGSAVVQTTPLGVDTTGHNFTVGVGSLAVGTTFNIRGSATVSSGNRFLVGGSNATNNVANNITVNQTAGTLTTAVDVRVGDAGGYATYNLSGGTIVTTNGVLVGRQGTGRMFQTGGTVIAPGASGLRVGDSEVGTLLTNNGLWQISGGTINASNIALGNNGTGTLSIVGQDGKITGSGNFTANANPVGTFTTSALAFKLESGESLTEVVMSGTASFAAGTFVTIDPDGNTPTQSSYDLLTATSIVDGGLSFTAPSGWALRIVPGGSGQILQATVPEPTSLALLGLAALALRRRRRGAARGACRPTPGT